MIVINLLVGCAVIDALNKPIPVAGLQKHPDIPGSYIATNKIIVTVLKQNEVEKLANRVGLTNVMAFSYQYDGGMYIFVPYSLHRDKYGRLLPDFDSLGHELWHLPEYGGSFHSK